MANAATPDTPEVDPKPLIRVVDRRKEAVVARLDAAHLEVRQAPELREQLEGLGTAGEAVVLDADGVQFMDGSTIAVLVYVRDQLRRHGSSAYSWLTLAAGTSVAAFVAVGRVAAGKHFPTDVATGAAVGASVGTLIPAMHDIPVVVLPAAFDGSIAIERSQALRNDPTRRWVRALSVASRSRPSRPKLVTTLGQARTTPAVTNSRPCEAACGVHF